MGSTKYQVVTDAGLEGAGVLVWWELHGSASYDDIVDALEAAGLSEAFDPPEASLEQALTAAVRSHCGERRKSGVLALRRNSSWYLIEASVAEEGEDLELAAFARIRLRRNADGDQVLVKRIWNTAWKPFVGKIVAAFTAEVESANIQATSSWLSRVHQSALNGVRLRDNGGVYFIPAQRRADWELFWKVLKKVGAQHQVWGVDAMPTDQTVACVLDAIQKDVERVLDACTAKLDAHEELPTRTANVLERDLKEAEQKLTKYAGIVGPSLDVFQDRLRKTRALVGLARIVSNG